MTGVILGKKDSVFAEFKELDSLKNRIALSKFIIEDALLVNRAIQHGLAVEKIIYTERFLTENDSDGIVGQDVIKAAKTAGISHYKINDGLLSAITATRPLPSVMASVQQIFVDVDNFNFGGSLLVIDSVANPDNLGMILRTADASGIDGVAIIGNGASLFHKNCVRAARGAVGRLPILSNTSDTLLTKLQKSGMLLVGTTADATNTLYDISYNTPTAFIVGNESHGIRPEVLAQCCKTVSIPMLPGRDSLSVGVAAGIILYELVRYKHQNT